MQINAHLRSSAGQHEVRVGTNGSSQTLAIGPKATGPGSSVNGGELLFLALATCYCNDIYREAARRGLKVDEVEVEVQGEFGAEGEPARNVTYRAKVAGPVGEAELRDLMLHVDQIAEIHNTLRGATPVRLAGLEPVSR